MTKKSVKETNKKKSAKSKKQPAADATKPAARKGPLKRFPDIYVYAGLILLFLFSLYDRRLFDRFFLYGRLFLSSLLLDCFLFRRTLRGGSCPASGQCQASTSSVQDVNSARC